MDEDGSPSQPKGKRELSTSKRAAQNRAAQVWETKSESHSLADRSL
jgi:hypothetical protein